MAANMAANLMENEYIHKISCYNMLPVSGPLMHTDVPSGTVLGPSMIMLEILRW